MLTATFRLADHAAVIIGIDRQDLEAMALGAACTLDGASFDMPELRILVLRADSEADFRTFVMDAAREMAAAVEVPLIEVETNPARRS